MILLIQHTLGFGGASDSYRRIQKTLQDHGNKVLSYSFFGCEETEALFKRRSLKQRSKDKVRSIMDSEHNIKANEILPEAKTTLSTAKLIILFNLHGGSTSLDDITMIRNCTKATVVLRASDVFWLTGRCAFPSFCEKYKQACDVCEFLQEYPEGKNPKLENIQLEKQKIFSNAIDIIIAPSNWIARQFSATYPDKEIILARNAFNFSFQEKPHKLSQRRSLIFCASSLTDYRKGFHLLIDALQQYADYFREMEIHFVGATESDLIEKYPFLSTFQGLNIHGRLQKDQLIKKFQQVDIYIHLALADNFPNTILMAHYLGIPTIALDKGGVNELVKLHNSGICLQNGCPSDIVVAIKAFYENQNFYEMNAQKLQKQLGDYCNEEKALIALLQRTVGEYEYDN